MTTSYRSRKKNIHRHPVTEKEAARFLELIKGKGLVKLRPHENNKTFMERMEHWYKAEQKHYGIKQEGRNGEPTG